MSFFKFVAAFLRSKYW